MAGPAGRNTGATDDGRRTLALEREAVGLVELMPDILMEADRIAATVAHGIHGRRRSGPGETFWQFRQYQSGEGAHLIDWRRSAGTTTLFVREREWEAAHTIYLWPNLSASMRFKSHLSKTSKQHRALVLTLAAAELLVRGGERVALLGVTQPTASRRATQRLAHTIVAEAGTAFEASLPRAERLARFSSVILVSDFLDPIDSVREAIEALGAAGAHGHLIQVLDPAEETLPYAGRTEFQSPDGSERWVADRVEGLRERYVERMLAHRAAIQEVAHRIGWSFLVHHTDRSASEPLLALMAHLSGSGAALRWKGTELGAASP